MNFTSKLTSGAQTIFAMGMVSMLVIACGGGGGGGGTAASTSLTSFTATPMKGQFCAGAQVTVYDATNTPIGTSSVNASGVASLSVPSNAAAPLHVTVGAGASSSCYWDEATATYVTIPAATTTLNAAVPSLQQAAASGVGLTFFTELAYQKATSGVPIASLTASSVQAANTAVAQLFGLAASGVADVLTPPTLIGQNTPKLASSTSSKDLYALAIATMAKVASNSTPGLKPNQVASQWLSSAIANPASGVAALPEAQTWNASWSAMTVGASSMLAAGVTVPAAPALSSSDPLNGPVVSFGSVNTYLRTNGYSGNFTLTGSAGTTPVAITGSGTINLGAAVSGTLNGAAVLQQTLTTTGQLSSTYASSSLGGTATKYIDAATFVEKAISSSSGYMTYPAFSYPASLQAGQSGNLATATIYLSNSIAVVLGTEKYSYSVAADTTSTLLLTFIYDGYDTNNAHAYQEKDTFRITANGAATPVSSQMINYGTGSSLSGTLPFTFNMAISPSSTPALSPVPTATPTPVTPPAPTFTPNPSPAAPLSQSVAYQIDYAHSGQAQLTGPIAFPAAPAWSVTLGGAATYPIIAGGKVFVLTKGLNSGYGSQLYALDKVTGNIVWGPIAISSTLDWSAHAYDHGKIFVITYSGLLKSFDANTGAAGWSTQLPNQWAFSSPPTAVNGLVYVGGSGSGGTLNAVDEANGNVVWTQRVINGDNSSPTVSSDGVFVSYPGQVYKFDPLTGTQIWHYSNGTSGGGGATSVYANGLLYVRDWPNLAMGQIIYNATTGILQAGNLPSPTIGAFTTQSGFINNGGALQGINLSTGNTLWFFSGDGTLDTAPIVINGQYVIIGGASGNVYAVDATTGTQVWSGNAGASISAPSEQYVFQPLTGLGAGESMLVVPAGKVLTAWKIGP